MERSDIKINIVRAYEVFGKDKDFGECRLFNQRLYVADYDYTDQHIRDEIDQNGGWEYFLEECKRHGFEFFSFVDEDGNVKYYTYDSDAVISNGVWGNFNRRVLERLGEI